MNDATLATRHRAELEGNLRLLHLLRRGQSAKPQIINAQRTIIMSGEQQQ
jgi:hypothetical protein